MTEIPTTPAAEDHGHVLVVDDDPQIRLLVARFLQRHGYKCPPSAPMAQI